MNVKKKYVKPSIYLCDVKIYPKGVKTRFLDQVPMTGGKEPEHLRDTVRGEIKYWSPASRSRLRNFLLTHTAVGQPYALTLTIPGSIVELSEWSAMVKLFWSFVQSKKVPCVWRVELQKRKQPHLHIVAWGESSSLLLSRWRMLVRDLPSCTYTNKQNDVITCNRMAITGAFEHCAVLSVCENNSSAWWRYLCDHTSKSKQAQLGFKGRQWGVVHRKGFIELPSSVYSLSLPEWYRFMRILRRLTRSRKWRGSRGSSVWFSNPITVTRLVVWAKSF